jgi:hypothetical protein
MKNSILVLCASLILFSSCNKKELLGTGSAVVVDKPQHCYNEKKDADETNTDCGGSCKPCVAVVAPCKIASNTLTEASKSQIFTSVTYNNGVLRATCASSDYVELGLRVDSLSKISYPITYTLVGPSSTLMDSQVMTLSINSSGQNLNPSDGNSYKFVYINKSGANLIFEFCDVVVTGNSFFNGPISKTFSSRIEIPVKY